MLICIIDIAYPDGKSKVDKNSVNLSAFAERILP